MANSNRRASRRLRLRPKHFKFLLTLNMAFVVIVKILSPDWFLQAIALALIFTILDVFLIALAQD